MSEPRKIEPGCYAIIRATGELVTVRKRYPGYRGEPDTFSTHLGHFRAGELHGITSEQYEHAKCMLDLADFLETL